MISGVSDEACIKFRNFSYKTTNMLFIYSNNLGLTQSLKEFEKNKVYLNLNYFIKFMI